jgi:hypothetical protein
MSVDLQFSANPTDDEISSARVFGNPIVSLGTNIAPGENAALAAALVAYRNRADADDASALENFLLAYPNSPRLLSLSVNLAGHYRRTSQFSRAMDTLEQVWAAGKGVTDPQVRQVVDQAVGERARLLIMFGRMDELKQLLGELQGRELHGVGAVLVSDAKLAVWQMENRPQMTFKCGPFLWRAYKPRWLHPCH